MRTEREKHGNILLRVCRLEKNADDS